MFVAVEKDGNANEVTGAARTGKCKWFNVLKGELRSIDFAKRFEERNRIVTELQFLLQVSGSLCQTTADRKFSFIRASLKWEALDR